MEKRNQWRAAFALGLSLAMTLGGTSALADMADEAMVGGETAATSQAVRQEANPSDQKGGEAAMGEELAAPENTVANEPASEGKGGEEVATADDGGEGSVLSTQADITGMWGSCVWVLDSGGAITLYPGTVGYNFESPLDKYSDSITSVQFASIGDWKVDAGSSTAHFFSYMKLVTSIDLTGLDTSNVNDMGGMFSGCTSLTSLNLGEWDTSKVTDMSYMFFNCSSLASLDLSKFDTSKVTDMHGMFSRCHSLSSLSVSNWDTSRVVDMDYMFSSCSSLSSLDVSRWDTSRVTDMSSMFSSCSSLSSLDLSGWDTSKVVSRKGPFPYGSSLTTLTVGSGYVMRDSYMFPEESYGNLWKSSATGRLYSKEDIVAGRSGIADTYTLVDEDANVDNPSPTPPSNDSDADMTSTPSSGYQRFPDVPSSAWYASVVSRAASLGLINGYSNGYFGPNDNVTRGQVAVILWNMAGKPAAGFGAKSFPDVRAGKYYYDAVRWASSVGVVSGYKNGRFGPDDNVTREQLAAMLANYAGKVAGKSVSGSATDYWSMKDVSKVSSWAAKSVGWCFRSKIISGTKDGRVNPQGNATRAETAKMVVFLYDLL